MSPLNRVEDSIWFDMPDSILSEDLADHVEGAHFYLRQLIGKKTSPDLYEKITFACKIWTSSMDTKVTKRCEKILRLAVRFAHRQATPNLANGDVRPLNYC